MGYDVVVIGAGFAGLTAARELAQSGFDPVVLEGRDRVGGRSSTTTLAGVPVDLGGTFVGPTQDAVLALAADLGCPTTPTYHAGTNLIRWRGRCARYRGTIPKLSLARPARHRPHPVAVRTHRPRRRHRRAVDGPRRRQARRQSLGGWLRSVGATATSRDLMAIMARVTWGAEPDEVSMLHAVRYVKAAGGTGPDARRRRRRAAGPLPRRHPADRRQDGRRARRAGAAGRRGVAHRMVRRRGGRHLVGRGGRGPPRHRGDPAGAPAGHRHRPGPADRVPAAGPAVAAGRAEQGLRRLPHARSGATPGTPVRRCPTRGRCSSPSTSAPATTGRASCWASPTPATSTRCHPSSAARRRWSGFAALFGVDAENPIDYLDQLLGRRDFRTGRADRRGAAGIVDAVRPAAAHARSVRCTGRAPRPPTNGPASWTARCAPGSARPPKWRR